MHLKTEDISLQTDGRNGLERVVMAGRAERSKTTLDRVTGIHSEIGESSEVLLNTRAYAYLRCLRNKERSEQEQTTVILSAIAVASARSWKNVRATPDAEPNLKKSSWTRPI